MVLRKRSYVHTKKQYSIPFAALRPYDETLHDGAFTLDDLSYALVIAHSGYLAPLEPVTTSAGTVHTSHNVQSGWSAVHISRLEDEDPYNRTVDWEDSDEQERENPYLRFHGAGSRKANYSHAVTSYQREHAMGKDDPSYYFGRDFLLLFPVPIRFLALCFVMVGGPLAALSLVLYATNSLWVGLKSSAVIVWWVGCFISQLFVAVLMKTFRHLAALLKDIGLTTWELIGNGPADAVVTVLTSTLSILVVVDLLAALALFCLFTFFSLFISVWSKP